MADSEGNEFCVAPPERGLTMRTDLAGMPNSTDPPRYCWP